MAASEWQLRKLRRNVIVDLDLNTRGVAQFHSAE
jgi:hypothetical protein